MPRKKDSTETPDNVIEFKRKPRAKRDYESEIPKHVDIDADADYSVLLAQADEARAGAALKVMQYQSVVETADRVDRINNIFRKALCAAG